jgi:hypothetical protein
MGASYLTLLFMVQGGDHYCRVGKSICLLSLLSLVTPRKTSPKREAWRKEIIMNLQQLKAKYANNTAAATTTASVQQPVTVSGVASKTWESTKSAAVSTGNYVKDIAPATNRRVNSIAAELNAQYNNHEKKLFKHEIMIDMIADATGVNLPADEVLEQYWTAEQQRIAAEAKAKAETEAKSEGSDEKAMAAKVMEYITEAFKKNGFVPKEEVKESPLAPEVQEYVKEQIKSAPKDEEDVNPADESTADSGTTKEARRKAALARKSTGVTEDVEESAPTKPKQRRFNCDIDGCRKKVFEKGDVCDACESVEEEEKETVPAEPKKKKGGRRKLGRQAPISNEEE